MAKHSKGASPTSRRSHRDNKQAEKGGQHHSKASVVAPPTTEPTTRICIKNVPPSIQTTQQVKQFLFASQQAYFAAKSLSQPLTITDCRLLSKRNMAFVGFASVDGAALCVQYLHATYWKTTKIVVEFALPPKEVAQKKKAQEKETTALEKKKETKETKSNDLEKKKKDFLKAMGAATSKPTRGAFWSNNDGALGTQQEQNTKEEGKHANSHEDEGAGDSSSNSQSDSDDDNDDDSSDSSKDDAEPLLESHKDMSDLDFLRAKTVQAEELPEAEQSSSSDDDQEEESDEDEAVPMKMDQTKELSPTEPSSTESQEEPISEPYEEVSSKRLFVRNLPFSVTEEDLSEYFSQFGTLDECHVPVDDQHRSKGFGFVSFQDPDRAQQAMNECDGKDFQGRIIQILPARSPKTSSTKSLAEPSTYKEKQELEKQNRAGKDQTGWSASFVRGDAVVDNLASRLGLKKGDVLGVKDGLSAGDAAVRMALGETAVIEENRKYFASHGIDMEALVSLPKGGQPASQSTIERSKTSILIKNLPGDTTKEDLSKTFGSAGVNPAKMLLPPSRTIAVVEYAHSNEAKSAFRKLAYRRFRDVPLYLEWAPLSAQVGEADVAQPEEVDLEKDQDKGESAEDSFSRAARPTLYVKNLNFSTTEDDLRAYFSSVSKDVKAVRIPQKVAPAKQVGGKVVREEKFVSMGFGFVEFGSKEAATLAMEELQGKMLAGHPLHLEPTKQTGQSVTPIDTKKKSSKLMVRNVPFQANRKELLTLFGSFGQLKKLRLPKKFDGNHRGFAFVDYVSSKEAAEAMKTLSRTHFYGRHLVIEWAEDEPEVGGVKVQSESIQPKNKKIKFTH